MNLSVSECFVCKVRCSHIVKTETFGHFTLETVSAHDIYLECERQTLILLSEVEFSLVAMGSCRHQRSRSALQVHPSSPWLLWDHFDIKEYQSALRLLLKYA